MLSTPSGVVGSTAEVLGTTLCSFQSLPVPFHRHHLPLLLGLNVVQSIERRHQESGFIIIIRLR